MSRQATRRPIVVLTDSPLLGDYSPRIDFGQRPDEDANFNRLGWWRKMRVFFLCLALIVVLTAEVIIRKLNVTYMRNYIPFLQILFIFACVLAFFGMTAWRRYHSRMSEVVIERKTMWWMIFIGLLDTLASALILCSAVFITAPLATLLSQGVIPLTMVASIWFLRRRFHANHWVGAALIMASNGVSIVLLYYAISGAAPAGVTAPAATPSPASPVPDFVWALFFFLSNFPIAASSIAKEALILANMNLDLPTLNAWVSLYQLVFSVVLAPAIYFLQHLMQETNLNDLPEVIWFGLKCWLLGTNSLADDQCEYAVWTVWVHIVIIVLLNVLVLRVIFHGSATLFFVASGVAIPLVLVCSALPFLGPARVGFFWGDIVNVVATLLGLFMYRMRAEDIEFDLPPFEGEPAVPPDVSMLNDEPLLESAGLGGDRDGNPPFTPTLSYLPNEYADADYDGRPSSPNISSPYAYSRRDDYWDADESDDERTIVVASMPGAVRGGVGHGAGGFSGFAVRLPPPPRLSLGGLASGTGAVTDAGASRSLNFAQF